uniref:NAD(P)-binding domain-containing protein n=1 Tax=Aegilops tauschii subsp. strangulata TaxID=200361 RepID=A0A453L5L5_AEGTS
RHGGQGRRRVPLGAAAPVPRRRRQRPARVLCLGAEVAQVRVSPWRAPQITRSPLLLCSLLPRRPRLRDGRGRNDAGEGAGPRLRRRRHREGRLPDRKVLLFDSARELIKLGFRVRAAVRSKERASPLVQSVERLELGEGSAADSRLELVECDLEKQGEAGIKAAIGDAALVVCSIGASEKEILDVTGPYRIDYVATDNLVRAAAKAGVEHFVLVTSLGTTRFGFPAALLNLFWGVLCWKKMAEEALVASGVPYTIVRPGGMERPTDAYKETHNLVVSPRDTYVGGLVSNLQVAELIACVAKNRRAAYCKVVELVAETTAPLLPTEDLLARVPSDPGRAPPPAKESPPAAAAAPAPVAAPPAPSPAPAPAAPPTPAPAPQPAAAPPAPAPAPAPAAAAKTERPLSPYAA